MKYIKITGTNMFWGKESLDKQDLIDVQQGRVDILIDLENKVWFNATTNTWELIPS